MNEQTKVGSKVWVTILLVDQSLPFVLRDLPLVRSCRRTRLPVNVRENTSSSLVQTTTKARTNFLLSRFQLVTICDAEMMSSVTCVSVFGSYDSRNDIEAYSTLLDHSVSLSHCFNLPSGMGGECNLSHGALRAPIVCEGPIRCIIKFLFTLCFNLPSYYYP